MQQKLLHFWSLQCTFVGFNSTFCDNSFTGDHWCSFSSDVSCRLLVTIGACSAVLVCRGPRNFWNSFRASRFFSNNLINFSLSSLVFLNSSILVATASLIPDNPFSNEMFLLNCYWFTELDWTQLNSILSWKKHTSWTGAKWNANANTATAGNSASSDHATTLN